MRVKATRSLFIAYFLAAVFTDSGGSYKITWWRQQRRLPPPSRGKFFLCFFWYYVSFLLKLGYWIQNKLSCLRPLIVLIHLYELLRTFRFVARETDLRLFLRLLLCPWFAASTQQEKVKVLASVILGYCLTVTILVVLLIYFGTHLPHLFKNSAINLRQCHRGSWEHHGTWLHTFRPAHNLVADHCVTEHLMWQLNINSFFWNTFLTRKMSTIFKSGLYSNFLNSTIMNRNKQVSH